MDPEGFNQVESGPDRVTLRLRCLEQAVHSLDVETRRSDGAIVRRAAALEAYILDGKRFPAALPLNAAQRETIARYERDFGLAIDLGAEGLPDGARLADVLANLFVELEACA